MVIYTEGYCKPFDENRTGLNLGEGAAYLLLESEEQVKKYNKKIYAELTGFANGNDAYHPSALSEEGTGPAQVMQEALAMAKLHPLDIDYINAHGTGTENNDLAEVNAMLNVFHKIPPFNSGKSYTGHTLGAASSISAVQALLCLENQFLFPSLGIETVMKKLLGNEPILTSQNTALKHVMSNSFGFGGNCVSLIFSKVE
jgi:3-oxoacyl-(acyl-carrier-protein) synthase